MTQTPQQILGALGLRACADDKQPAQGFLNTVHLAADKDGKLYVLRLQRGDTRADIEDYITRQIKFLGAADLGARLHYRSMPEQADFMRALAAANVKTPAVPAHGDDWILMQHVRGQSLKDIFEQAPSADAARAAVAVLHALMDTHKKGICLWDRWGGNELIDDKLNVCFIDFDLRIDFPADISARQQTALDLAFMLRGCLQFSRDAAVTAAALSDGIRARKDFAEIYDVPALSRFIDGQIRFYEAEYIGNPQTPDDLRGKHAAENEWMKSLRASFTAPQAAPRPAPPKP